VSVNVKIKTTFSAHKSWEGAKSQVVTYPLEHASLSTVARSWPSGHKSLVWSFRQNC